MFQLDSFLSNNVCNNIALILFFTIFQFFNEAINFSQSLILILFRLK